MMSNDFDPRRRQKKKKQSLPRNSAAEGRRLRRGVPVDEWLDRFYRPDDYANEEASAAVFRDGHFTDVRDDFRKALLLAFHRGMNDRVSFVPSPLNLPRVACMTGDQDARKRVCIVRKSSDALYVHGQTCGAPNCWRDTVIATVTKVSRLLKVCEAFLSRGEADVGHVGEALGVAIHTLRTLAFFCSHEPELRAYVRERVRRLRGHRDKRAEASVLLAALTPPDAATTACLLRGCETLRWFLRWYAYCGEDGDVAVGVHHAVTNVTYKKRGAPYGAQ